MPTSQQYAKSAALRHEYHKRARSMAEGKVLDWLKDRYCTQKILVNHNIRTLTPYYCGTLFLDFYLPDLGLAVEVDGPQHQRPVKHFQPTPERFASQKLRDLAKQDWCTERDVTLVRVKQERIAYLKGDSLEFYLAPFFVNFPREEL